MKSLLAFIFPAVIFPVPAGIVSDGVGAYGLFGLMANVNAYAESLASVATAGTNITLIPAQTLAGYLFLNSGASGPFTITLPPTGAIMAALPNSIPLDGSYSESLTFVNNLTGQPATIVAGDGGTTIVGTAVIGSNVARSYLLRVLNSSTLSLTNIGQSML